MADNLRARSEGSALQVPRWHAGNAPSPGESGENIVGATAKDADERAALLTRIAEGDDVDVGLVFDSGPGRWDIVYGADVPIHKVRHLGEGCVSLSLQPVEGAQGTGRGSND
jgi:hypothetical protein